MALTTIEVKSEWPTWVFTEMVISFSVSIKALEPHDVSE